MTRPLIDAGRLKTGESICIVPDRWTCGYEAIVTTPFHGKQTLYCGDIFVYTTLDALVDGIAHIIAESRYYMELETTA